MELGLGAGKEKEKKRKEKEAFKKKTFERLVLLDITHNRGRNEGCDPLPLK